MAPRPPNRPLPPSRRHHFSSTHVPAFLFLGFLLSLLTPTFANFDVRDMARLERVTGPVVSPDGRWFAFTGRTWNAEHDKTATLLYIQSTDPANAVSLPITSLTEAHAQVADTDPQWSPDSRFLAFLSDRSGSNQLWVADIERATRDAIRLGHFSAEASHSSSSSSSPSSSSSSSSPSSLPPHPTLPHHIYQLSNYPLDIDSLKWSPSGRYFAFSAEVYPNTTMQTTADILAQLKQNKRDTGMLFDRLYIRHWGPGWFEGRYRHLFVAEVSANPEYPQISSVSDSVKQEAEANRVTEESTREARGPAEESEREKNREKKEAERGAPRDAIIGQNQRDVLDLLEFPPGQRSMINPASSVASSSHTRLSSSSSSSSSHYHDPANPNTKSVVPPSNSDSDSSSSAQSPFVLGSAQDIMMPFEGDCPSRPFGGSEEFDFSPCDDVIAFSLQLGNDQAWSVNRDVYLAPLPSASKISSLSASSSSPESPYSHPFSSIQNLTPDNKARDNVPVFSPDCKQVAFLSTQVPKAESDRNRIVLYDRESGQKRVLTEQWDRSPDALKWVSLFPADIFALTLDRARVRLFAVSVKDGSVIEQPTEHSAQSFDICSGSSINVQSQWASSSSSSSSSSASASASACTNTNLFMSISSYTAPTDIFTVTPVTHAQTLSSTFSSSSSSSTYARLSSSLLSSSISFTQLTHRNSKLLTAFSFSEPESVTYAGARGDPIQAWFFRPMGFQENNSQQYPLIFYVHGGPESPWEDAWSYRWNPQTLTAKGYAVFAPNFHGSSSFGQAFTDSVQRQWGGLPYEDVLLGYDWVLSTHQWLDKKRVFGMGASFGGYMINWLNARAGSRFRALVCHDGVFDLVEDYYSTEELYFPEIEFGGPPYEAPEDYQKFSPSTYVQSMQTPTLIIHGGKDWRIPDTQGIAAFTALQRRGIPSKLLLFPDETHWVMKPVNSIRWHDEVLAWLEYWRNVQ